MGWREMEIDGNGLGKTGGGGQGSGTSHSVRKVTFGLPFEGLEDWAIATEARTSQAAKVLQNITQL